MRVCKECGLSDAETDFYPSINTYCKEHWKQRVKENRAANSDYYKEFDRKRANLPHRVEARKAYSKTEAFSASHKRASAKYQDKNKDRREAHILVGNAVRDGRLSSMPCFVCGCYDVEAHHADYASPLDVVWLCVKHHKKVHQEARATLRAA